MQRRFGRRSLGVIAIRWSAALLLLGSTGSVFAGPPALRNPDVRVDTGRGLYAASSARRPQILLQGDRAYAVYLDQRYFLAFEPYINVSVNQGGTWNTTDRRLNKDGAGVPEGDTAYVYLSKPADAYVFVLFLSNDGLQSIPSVVASPDGGETWKPQVDLAFADSNSREGFSIASAAGGKGYVLWSDNRLNLSGDKSVWLRRTTDGGSTWLTGQQVNVNEASPPPCILDKHEASTQPVMCTDGGSRLLVAWRDKRSATNPCTYVTAPGRIVLRYSTNGGTTFFPASETRLDRADGTPGTESQRPAIACNASEFATVVWEDARAGATSWNIYANVSQDGGVTWRSVDVRVSGGGPAGKQARNAKVAVGAGNPAPIYVAWEDNRDGGKDLYFSHSDDAGQTWATPQRLTTIASPTATPLENWDLSADGTAVTVAWSADNRPGPPTTRRSDVFEVHSTDGGVTFLPAQRLDLGTGPNVFDSAEPDGGAAGTGHIAIYADLRNDVAADPDRPRHDLYSGGSGTSVDPNDADADGLARANDNCPDYPNLDQRDRDSDGRGNLCDPHPDDPDNDRDLDGIASNLDNCPLRHNSNQDDTDADGWGDACDLCAGTADQLQRDLDRDGTGDGCDGDIDGDGVANTSDGDDDSDGWTDASENCPTVPNQRQQDEDHDGRGDDCDTDDLIVSNVNIRPDALQPPRMDWDKEPGASSYNVYVGVADRLATGHPGFCYAPSLSFYVAHLAAQPDPGQILWFLVTAKNGSGTEGSAGARSDGTKRPKPSPCDETAARDWDLDGFINARDNCRFDANADQTDRDKDGPGDVCDRFPGDPLDDEPDRDGVGSDVDNCPFIANRDQADADLDRIGDSCDDCPTEYDPLQRDSSGDGIGDACDPDSDGDGVPNAIDADDDNDGVSDATDDCAFTADSSQSDQDHDGTGDACDVDDREINDVDFSRGSRERIEWTLEQGAASYSVYTDLVSNIRPGGPYGSCFVPGTTLSWAEVPGTPAPGQARYYLVTGWFSGAQGTAGRASDGGVRTVPSGCQ